MTPELQQKIAALVLGLIVSVLGYLIRTWTKSVLDTLDASKPLPLRVALLEASNIELRADLATAQRLIELLSANTASSNASHEAVSLKVARIEGHLKLRS